MAKTSEAQLRAIEKYNRRMVRVVRLKLNHKTDADVLRKFESIENKTGYVKDLIRKDIENDV